MNNDVQLQVLIEKSMQLKIMHINTRSMISTFDGLLLTLKQDKFDEREKKKPVEWQNYQSQEEI